MIREESKKDYKESNFFRGVFNGKSKEFNFENRSFITGGIFGAFNTFSFANTFSNRFISPHSFQNRQFFFLFTHSKNSREKILQRNLFREEIKKDIKGNQFKEHIYNSDNGSRPITTIEGGFNFEEFKFKNRTKDTVFSNIPAICSFKGG